MLNWKFQLALCMIFIGGSTVACRNQDTVDNFRNLHSVFAFAKRNGWDEASNAKLNQMCTTVLGDDQVWDAEDYFENRPRQEAYNFDNDEQFQQHLQHVRKCCRKVSVFEKKICFKTIRENFFDAYCQHRSHDKCCQMGGNVRYQCFSRKREEQIPLEELEADDREPLPSGIKIRTGPVLLPENQPEQQIDDDDNENPIFSESDLVDADFDNENGYCLANDFPEDEIDSMTESVGNEVCPTEDPEGLQDGVTKRRCEAKACCRIGAFVGRRYVKKGCPYLKCRKFYEMFAKRHRKCIKHKRLCGFAFVACCQRQHHKDLYLGYDHPETENNFGEMID